jgi:hypothetical protein
MAQQVYVVHNFGEGDAVGLIDPKVNMVTQFGTITAINGDIATIGTGSENRSNQYINDLMATYAHVTGSWSFPTGDGSIAFGGHNQLDDTRSGVFSNGTQINMFAA